MKSYSDDCLGVTRAGKEPPLNAVMMLWVNLIMDTMGALALVRGTCLKCAERSEYTE